MDLDLDTLMTTLYVLIDDWYKAEMESRMKRHGGPAVKMTDSEVLTVAIAGQWRAGVPWQSERGVVRYMHKHGRHWFPNMLQRSAFNERVRKLWVAFICLQQQVAVWLQRPQDIYEVVDCVPLPACSVAQAESKHGHWLWWSSKGYGGTHGGWYWGEQTCMSVTPQGAVTSWIIGSAHADDRWFLHALLSQRTAQPDLMGPPPRQADRTVTPPPHLGPIQACGSTMTTDVFVTDKGFGGWRWREHWQHHCKASIVCAPQKYERGHWSRAWHRWLNSMRQIVETTFAVLTNVFDWQRLRAHSRWGQYTRVAIALAALNLGIFINHQLGRPPLSHETLIC